MKQYLDLLRDVLVHGDRQMDRTGVGTLSLFGGQLRFDLSEGFPLVTTKKVFTRGIIHELLWLLKGDTNIKYLQDNKVHIWDEWADENGDLGPVYGKQWRSWGPEGHDQIEELLRNLVERPYSRRHIVSAYNVDDLPDEGVSPQENARNGKMALAPCHTFFQFNVDSRKRLSCQLYQRSADMFLGVPFNIASYALLTCMIADTLGFERGDFVHTFGNYHIYLNHIEQVREQLRREPRPMPRLYFRRTPESVLDYTFDDIEIVGYDPYPAIKGQVAV